MESLLITLGYGCAALLCVATLVAAWEHWRRRSADGAAPTPTTAPAPIRVDVDLVNLDRQPAASDWAQRQTAVDATLARLAAPAPAASSPAPWIETRPMISLGPLVEPKAETARH